ncbi:MAG: ATP-dependent DNA helicase RecG [Christensenella sp.]|uniref:ATP-dependent DNA helicase RecG n=1 Tax=Christensenella sp. TaxID=1935934 RepID=UPI002B2011C1|nr:ATP-dependent DNA helicase RecG [Christensenella sp.]MEA5004767.1 ATP-dependent DNA helicase RecG [Christensenella sp.]
MELLSPVTQIGGVGEKTAKTLQKIDVSTVKDLLYYLPRTYKDLSTIKKISEVKFGETAFLEVKIFTQPQVKRIRRGLEITSFQVTDATGIANVDIFNQIYIKNNLTVGQTIYLYGKLEFKFSKIVISAPEIYFKKPDNPFLPIYPLTAGLKQNMMRKFVKDALYKTELKEYYSTGFLQEFKLPDIKKALHDVHFPNDIETASVARARIVFDELLVFNRMMELLGEEKRQKSAAQLTDVQDNRDDFLSRLSFELTGAQLRVMKEMESDLTKDMAMNRLVQGDVGSGKTVIAFYAMHCMYEAGFQSVLMAPTEILAQQHYETAKELFDQQQIVCVTGALSAKSRKEINAKIADGEVKIIIGTHALLYGNVKFAKLGLIITDEQHRFGVKQRAALTGDKSDVHTLIMSATPIPRSLQLVLFGNTDISIVDELPPGRKPVKTYLIHQNKYQDMISFIKNELHAKHQAYIVCPLIEDSENMEAKSATQIFNEMKQYYAGFRMALIHGKMKNMEKQEIMDSFCAGEIDVLVSTTVIEVGINVPNATSMVVINAERFGLAQLHQLRGRVGRGSAQSYCFLVSDNESAYERLRVLTNTNDGFEIAEQDMQMRGTGDILGTRQHGTSTLKVANLIADIRQLEQTRDVLKIMKKNRQFAQEYRAITQAARRELKNKMIEIALN